MIRVTDCLTVSACLMNRASISRRTLKLKRIAAIATMIAFATATPTLADYQNILVYGHDAEQNGIIGPDDREPMEWDSAIGRKIVRLLDRNGGFRCTGTVIGPSLVLAAAHCLKRNDRWLQGDERITYVETWDGNRSRIRNRRVLVDWDGMTRGSEDDSINSREFAWDVGLVFTSEVVAERTGTMRVIPLESGLDGPAAVELAAFHGDIDDLRGPRLVREICLAQFGTYIVPLNVWRVPHGCDVEDGSSGGPLLISIGNGERAVAAINVASDFSWWHRIGWHNTGVRVDKQDGFVMRWIRKNFEEHGWEQPARPALEAWR